jgi:hypothetical protein
MYSPFMDGQMPRSKLIHTARPPNYEVACAYVKIIAICIAA